MPRAGALAGPAVAPRSHLFADEVAAIEHLAPALEAAARADEALVRAIGAASDSVRCFKTLQELDAAASPILEILYKRAARGRGSREWARQRARAAFRRLRTALFPGASRKKAPRYVFAASAKPRSALSPAPKPPAAVERKAPADRSAPPPWLPLSPPPPPSAEEAAAAAAASAAAAARRKAGAEAREDAARLVREAAVAAQNERDGRALVADGFVVSKGAGVTVAETTTGTRERAAAICFSTLAAAATAAAVAPAAAASAGDEGDPLFLAAIRGFVSHVFAVAPRTRASVCVVDASVSVTALEVPAEPGAATCSARPVSLDHVELSGEVALARYHSVQAHNDVELTFRNRGSSPLLLSLQGRELEDGYVAIDD